jgi:hypothetical protein
MIPSDDRTTKGALLNTHGEEQAAAWTRFLAMSVRSALYVLALLLPPSVTNRPPSRPNGPLAAMYPLKARLDTQPSSSGSIVTS